MMNAYGSYTLLEAIGRKKNLKILLAHLVTTALIFRTDRRQVFTALAVKFCIIDESRERSVAQ